MNLAGAGTASKLASPGGLFEKVFCGFPGETEAGRVRGAVTGDAGSTKGFAPKASGLLSDAGRARLRESASSASRGSASPMRRAPCRDGAATGDAGSARVRAALAGDLVGVRTLMRGCGCE